MLAFVQVLEKSVAVLHPRATTKLTIVYANIVQNGYRKWN